MSQSDNRKWVTQEPEQVAKLEVPAMAEPENHGLNFDCLKRQFQDIVTAAAWGWILITGILVVHYSYPFIHRSEFSLAASELRARGLEAEAADLEEVGKVCRDDIGAPRACALVYRHVQDWKQPAIASAGRPAPAMPAKVNTPPEGNP